MTSGVFCNTQIHSFRVINKICLPGPIWTGEGRCVSDVLKRPGSESGLQVQPLFVLTELKYPNRWIVETPASRMLAAPSEANPVSSNNADMCTPELNHRKASRQPFQPPLPSRKVCPLRLASAWLCSQHALESPGFPNCMGEECL